VRPSLRRALFAALATATATALWPAAPASAQLEPVELNVSVPLLVRAGAPIEIGVEVAAEPGALDIAAPPLRLRVALEPECGGSFAGTAGKVAIDREIPAPAPGAAYEFSGRGRTRVKRYGPETVCAFLEDSQERQFATSTEALVEVSRACTLAGRRLARLRRGLRRAHGQQRRALNRKLRGAKRHRRLACRARRPSARSSAYESAPPRVKHLFIVVLENEDEEVTFGPDPPARYLGKTLPASGVLVPNYFGIGHNSLDNYLAMISGQPPNVASQADCPIFSEMAPGALNGEGVAVGAGCVYPPEVETVAGQLEEKGRTWHGYMQDMAASGSATCGHPAIGSQDRTQAAGPTSQYATRHDPFVYFHSIIDSPACRSNVVDLGTLPGDLRSESATPEYSFITPDLCADGHEPVCADTSQPAGFEGINAFLEEWIPKIEASAAYQDRGMIIVTFDESDSAAEACCGETTGPNTINNGGTMPGPGGGRVGAVMVSPCITPNTVSDADYNHYSMLRWVEDNFGLGHLAEAAPEAVGSFGSDILSRPDCDRKAKLGVRPRRTEAGARTIFRFRLRAGLPLCRAGATIRFAGRRAKTNRKGIARLRARLRGRGTVTARATSSICLPARAKVRVRAAR
jgi:phosphatidylinositol-3-phosphatase